MRKKLNKTTPSRAKPSQAKHGKAGIWRDDEKISQTSEKWQKVFERYFWIFGWIGNA